MTTKTTKTNRIYKDSLFKHVFANEKYKQFTLDLYNTLNQTDYTDPDAIEFITLEDVFYINVKNDAGFIIFNNMVLTPVYQMFMYYHLFYLYVMLYFSLY